MLIRSLLFAPANRVELLKKFPRYDADAFAIDLEDGTPESEKASARQQLSAVVGDLRAQDVRGLLFVRTNAATSSHLDEDLACALRADIDGLIVPKVDTADDLIAFSKAVRAAGAPASPPIALVAVIETMAGVLNVKTIASADSNLRAICFGGEDFISDIGGVRTQEGLEVLYARSQVVIAAKARGLQAIDQVVVDIRDEDQFRRDAALGRNLGYDGKMCLLPRQVELANEVFSPTLEEIDRSRRLVAAYEAAVADGRGVIDFEGRMIDSPLLTRARSVLEMAVRLDQSRRRSGA